MLITIIIFITIMSFLVLIHEFGHFYSAKRQGVEVEEFGIGIPPRLFGKKIKGTLFSINLLPFGGFVKLRGEEGTKDSSKAYDYALKDPLNYLSKKPLQKLEIILAGIFMNVIVTFVVFYVLFLFTNFRTLTLPLLFEYIFPFGKKEILNTAVTGVLPNSPAYVANIENGEVILEVNGNPVYKVEDLRTMLDQSEGEVSILLMDIKTFSREIRSVTLTPTLNEDQSKTIGVILGKAITIDYRDQKALSGILHSVNMLGYTIHVFGTLIQESFSQRNIAPISVAVSGPVGVVAVIDSFVKLDSFDAFVRILDLVGLLSLSLAFMNFLPVPALDGGRAVFAIIELLRGRPIHPKYEAEFHKWGFMALLVLFVLVTIKDFRFFF